jgi:hypothetical protein
MYELLIKAFPETATSRIIEHRKQVFHQQVKNIGLDD